MTTFPDGFLRDEAFIKAFEPPPYMIAAMRAAEEERKAAEYLRYVPSSLELDRIAMERSFAAERIEELTRFGRYNDIALVQATADVSARLWGSSNRRFAALYEETQRERDAIEASRVRDAVTSERLRELHRIEEQWRAVYEIPESTYGLSWMLREAALARDTSGFGAFSSILGPYNALERACSSVLDHQGLFPRLGASYPDTLTFAPVILPNLVAAIALATLSPEDLDKEEIEESLNSLKDLAPVHRPQLMAQLNLIHDRVATNIQIAREVSKTKSSERTSLCCFELRRAMDFALESLAPEKGVRAWMVNHMVQAHGDGRPKRITQFTYIFRDVDGGYAVGRMFFASCVAFNRLYSQLSKECHTGTSDFDGLQLDALITNVEAMLYSFSCITYGHLS